ncbi:MAG: helix-turn-helix domain-containing protein [Candidatus Omnitrophota bacterium]|jgi:transcriptional regulator with XRE-family HTH domain
MKRKKREAVYESLAREAAAKGEGAEAEAPLDFKANILRLRRERGLSGAELCRRAGDLDARTLTALEKGRILNPSIKTLQSLARGFGIPVSGLFREAEAETDCFCHAGSQKGAYRIELPEWGVQMISYVPFIRDFFCGKFILAPRARLEDNVLKHPCPVFLSALIGRCEISVEHKSFVLKEGDNLFFNGNLRHSFYNPLHRESALWVVTAPSFIGAGL